jgi:hypothetical protein
MTGPAGQDFGVYGNPRIQTPTIDRITGVKYGQQLPDTLEE